MDVEAAVRRACLAATSSVGALTFEARAEKAWGDFTEQTVQTLLASLPVSLRLLDDVAVHARQHAVLAALWDQLHSVMNDFHLCLQGLAVRHRQREQNATPACSP